MTHIAERPFPRFVARVGVTGHRPNNAAYPPTGLDGAITAALHLVDDAVHAAHDIHRGDYSSDPPTIRMISGLAEGADHLAAALRPARWGLDALLPMPVEQYRIDFTAPDRRIGPDAVDLFDTDLRQASTVLELPVHATDTNDPMSYARQGLVLARQIDLLVAVWDGAPARGLGGTADVIAFAREENVPVVWIPLAADAQAVLLESPMAQDLGRLPERLAQIFDVHDRSQSSPKPAPPSDTRGRASPDAWRELLGRIGHTGAFGDRLCRAAAPLLDHAIHSHAEELADAVRTAILLLPAVALTAATTKPWASQPARSRLAALVREVGLPSARIDADYIVAHCATVAETVAAPWPALVARLRAVGGQPSLDLVWRELTGIASDLLGRRCERPQRCLSA